MKKIVIILLSLVLVAVPLLGLAEDIAALPDTYDELCALLPTMPDMNIQDVSVRFPHETGISGQFQVYCDDSWEAVRWYGMFSADFVFDETLQGYILPAGQSCEKVETNYYTGMNGHVALAKKMEDDWRLNVVIYYSGDVYATLFSMTDASESGWTWANVTDDTNAGMDFLMPNVIAAKQTDTQNIEIWQYADRTIAVLRDANGQEIDRKEYPEFSAFCHDFKPINPLAQ